MTPLHLIGERFGRLLVVAKGELANGRVAWICQCDCDPEGVRLRPLGTSALRSGNTKSCGCLALEVRRSMHITHGHSSNGERSAEYGVWANVLRRGQGKVALYAERGISMCERWLTFENFLEDMGPRPPGASIDRIDNDRGYEPGNCRWATRQQQNRNKRDNHLLDVEGRLATIAEWSERSGIKPSTIHARLARGWTPEAAIFKVPTPSRLRGWESRRAARA